MASLNMMLWIADQNAAEVKYRDKTRGPLRGNIVTTAMIEKQEWDAFRAKLAQRKKFLVAKSGGVGGSMIGGRPGPVDVDILLEEGAALDVDEDDIDQLMALVNIFDEHYETQRERAGRGGTGLGLTLAEVVKALQRAGVVSLEFTASAREQTKRLLRKLREMNRVWQDDSGRWSLL